VQVDVPAGLNYQQMKMEAYHVLAVPVGALPPVAASLWMTLHKLGDCVQLKCQMQLSHSLAQ
jgi:hypothetical protein